MSSVFKTVDGALAFRGGFDSHALSQWAFFGLFFELLTAVPVLPKF